MMLGSTEKTMGDDPLVGFYKNRERYSLVSPNTQCYAELYSHLCVFSHDTSALCSADVLD